MCHSGSFVCYFRCMYQVVQRVMSYLVNYLTFPGVVIHELAHKIFCEEFGVSVRKVRYFRLGNPIGYVIHDEPGNVMQAFWISVGPLLVNTIFALGASYAASYFNAGDYRGWTLLWIGFSAGVHAFPSDADISNVASGRKGLGGLIVYVFVFPIVLLLRLANKLRPYGFDLVYAITLTVVGLGFW